MQEAWIGYEASYARSVTIRGDQLVTSKRHFPVTETKKYLQF
jgi:hypothetical protein